MSDSVIWANNLLSRAAEERLVRAVGAKRLILGEVVSDWPEPEVDHRARDADIIFGQPHPTDIIESRGIKWAHISTSGIDRYDNEGVRAAIRHRDAIMTNSSDVYYDAVAQHVVAFILADCRQLLFAIEMQRAGRDAAQMEIRRRSRMINELNVLIVGYGRIGRRLAELIKPFGANVMSLRRAATEDDLARAIAQADLPSALAAADHVVNILPDNPSTANFFDSDRFRQMKRGARYYSVGRGITTDHGALADVLNSGWVSAAYLDVTDPEPLPTGHPLRAVSSCFVTPHCASGHHNEDLRLVEHFLENLRRFESGATMLNRII
jgi:phosphoglycerate dehydrogenase-like enzyme